MEAYEDFEETVDGMSASQVMEVYQAAMAAKGQGSGTDIGFMISNFADYQQMMVAGFDFYNECNLDYYMVAVGSNSQNPSGISNLLVNLLFRTFNGEDSTLSDLATATTAYLADTSSETLGDTLGKASGNLIRVVLQVEIPTTSQTEVAYYQTASSFARRR